MAVSALSFYFFVAADDNYIIAYCSLVYSLVQVVLHLYFR